MKKHLLLLLFPLFVFIVSCSVPQRAPENIQFTILQMNDVYEIKPLEGGKAGGLARVATVKKELLAENPNTISVLSGDFLSPSFIGTLRTEEGEKIFGLQMIETLNAMGLSYATFGNHEFDTSDPELLKKRIDQCAFKYACCNVQLVENGTKAPFTQGGETIPSYVIHEFSNPSGDKVKVALIGVVLPFNKQEYLHYDPVIKSYQEAYKKARMEADVVLAMTHLNVEEDLELAEKVPGTPLFMGGHDHHHMNHYVERTIITKADANAKTVYIHRVNYNPASGMVEIRSSLKKIDDTIKGDPITQEVVTRWTSKVGKIMDEMGYDPDRQVFLAKVPLECKEADVRTRPTNFGKLTVKAMQSVWPGADVYLINSGSMRLDDNISGMVTEYDILRTYPFGGNIVRMEIPGKDLPKILKIGLENNVGAGGYFQISDVVMEDGKWLINGQSLDPSKKYKVVLPQFVAEGKEANLEMLENYQFDSKPSFDKNGNSVKNDIRDIVISYMLQKESNG